MNYCLITNLFICTVLISMNKTNVYHYYLFYHCDLNVSIQKQTHIIILL